MLVGVQEEEWEGENTVKPEDSQLYSTNSADQWLPTYLT